MGNVSLPLDGVQIFSAAIRDTRLFRSEGFMLISFILTPGPEQLHTQGHLFSFLLLQEAEHLH